MDLEEAGRRLRANLRIVFVAILLGIVLPIALHVGGGAVYKASARLMLDVRDPSDAGGSQAIADAAHGIAASPGRVALALRQIGADRNAERFARENISVGAIGGSPLLELSVIDRTPSVASNMANALADEVVNTRNALSQGQLADVLLDLDRRIAAATAAQQALEPAFQQATGVRGLSPAVERYRGAVRLREDLEEERRRLLQSAAVRPQAALIDHATVPVAAETSGLSADVALGAVLGLVLGLGISAIRETLDPTVAGERSISLAIHAPAMGRLSGRPGRFRDEQLGVVAARLRLAAEATGFRTLMLTGVGQKSDLDTKANGLQDALHAVEAATNPLSRNARSPVQVLAIDSDGVRAMGEAGATVGLVVVAPLAVKKRRLEWVMDLRSMTGWKVLGFIIHGKRARGRDRRRSTVRVTETTKATSERTKERIQVDPPKQNVSREIVLDPPARERTTDPPPNEPARTADLPPSSGGASDPRIGPDNGVRTVADRDNARWGRSVDEASGNGSSEAADGLPAQGMIALELSLGDHPNTSNQKQDVGESDGGVSGGSSEKFHE